MKIPKNCRKYVAILAIMVMMVGSLPFMTNDAQASSYDFSANDSDFSGNWTVDAGTRISKNAGDSFVTINTIRGSDDRAHHSFSQDLTGAYRVQYDTYVNSVTLGGSLFFVSIRDSALTAPTNTILASGDATYTKWYGDSSVRDVRFESTEGGTLATSNYFTVSLGNWYTTVMYRWNDTGTWKVTCAVWQTGVGNESNPLGSWTINVDGTPAAMKYVYLSGNSAAGTQVWNGKFDNYIDSDEPITASKPVFSTTPSTTATRNTQYTYEPHVDSGTISLFVDGQLLSRANSAVTTGAWDGFILQGYPIEAGAHAYSLKATNEHGDTYQNWTITASADVTHIRPEMNGVTFGPIVYHEKTTKSIDNIGPDGSSNFITNVRDRTNLTITVLNGPEWASGYSDQYGYQHLRLLIDDTVAGGTYNITCVVTSENWGVSDTYYYLVTIDAQLTPVVSWEVMLDQYVFITLNTWDTIAHSMAMVPTVIWNLLVTQPITGMYVAVAFIGIVAAMFISTLVLVMKIRNGTLGGLDGFKIWGGATAISWIAFFAFLWLI